MDYGIYAALPALHRIQMPAEIPFIRNLVPASQGLAATLPEWNAGAASWALTLALHIPQATFCRMPVAIGPCVCRVYGELCS